MGFNLNRRCTTINLCSSTHLTEKRIKESKNPDTNKSLVSIVDCDVSLDVLPEYDAFPLEAQLASGVPLNHVNPTVLSDQPQNVESLVDTIISDKNFSETSNTNE